MYFILDIFYIFAQVCIPNSLACNGGSAFSEKNRVANHFQGTAIQQLQRKRISKGDSTANAAGSISVSRLFCSQTREHGATQRRRLEKRRMHLPRRRSIVFRKLHACHASASTEEDTSNRLKARREARSTSARKKIQASVIGFALCLPSLACDIGGIT